MPQVVPSGKQQPGKVMPKTLTLPQFGFVATRASHTVADDISPHVLEAEFAQQTGGKPGNGRADAAQVMVPHGTDEAAIPAAPAPAALEPALAPTPPVPLNVPAAPNAPAEPPAPATPLSVFLLHAPALAAHSNTATIHTACFFIVIRLLIKLPRRGWLEARSPRPLGGSFALCTKPRRSDLIPSLLGRGGHQFWPACSRQTSFSSFEGALGAANRPQPPAGVGFRRGLLRQQARSFWQPEHQVEALSGRTCCPLAEVVEDGHEQHMAARMR